MNKCLLYLASLALTVSLSAASPAYAHNRHTIKSDAAQKAQSINESTSESRHSFYDKIQSIIKDYEAAHEPKAIAEPDSILGPAVATPQQCVHYLLEHNPDPRISVTPYQLVSYYYEEGKREGVRPDIAFAQALVETGYFRYTGTVHPDQNNYCGLGTTSAIVRGAYFPTSLIGVRAHIQHLLAYASVQMPKEPIVDPRYSLVRDAYGHRTLTTWQQLNGRWAVPGKTYGQNILRVYEAILKTKPQD